ENRHVRVEIPDVSAAFLVLPLFVAQLEFGGVMLLGIRIEMGAGEDDLLAVRTKEGTRGFANAGTDAAIFAALQIHDENLVKRIFALLLSLENDGFLVRREVAFTGADEIMRHLSDVLQMSRFQLLPIIGGLSSQGE